jgi:CRP/FNR family cyclic AMP-dependent transcriptional regulator
VVRKGPSYFANQSARSRPILATFARTLRDGEVLFRAGDVGDGCYRIQIGLVKIVVASQQGEERIISLLGPNAIVGELSMIDGRPRSASVVAIADCSLSYVSQDKFQKYSEAHPELTRTLARRLRDADEALAAADFARGSADPSPSI